MHRWFITLVLPVLGLALLTALPFAEIAAANVEHGLNLPRLFRHLGTALEVVFLAAIMLRTLFYRVPFWRISTALAPVVFLFFAFEAINLEWGLGSGLPPARIGVEPGLTDDVPVLLAVWGLVLLAVFGVSLHWLRNERAIGGLVLAGVLLLVQPFWIIVAGQGKDSAATKNAPLGDYLFGDRQAHHPNIYWLVADGYPRADVLARDFDFDNQPFLETLGRLGFVVPPDMWANYPATIYSVASIASMDYLVDENSSMEKVRDLDRYRRILRGESRLVETLRAMGYRYVQFANGYDYLTLCGGTEDLCIVGNKGPDRLDVTVLRRTPLLAVLAWHAMWRSADKKADPLFYWQAFDALEDHLPEIREMASPYFLYAHVMAPHPPLRHTAECGMKLTFPGLKSWNPANRKAFIDEIRCVNLQLESVVRAILRHDPSAILVLNGDHGSAFLQPFSAQPDHWNRAQIAERMAPLAALRVPEACRQQAGQTASLVNLFRVVVGCVAGKDIPLLDTHLFVTPYDDSSQFGRVFVYTKPE